MGRKHKANTNAAIELLCERFPHCFFMHEARRVPLKIGIFDDLAVRLDGAVEPVLIGLALRNYTWNLAYRRSQKQGRPRIDLDGNEAGTVSEADALSAARDVISRTAALRERKRLARAQAKASPAPKPETSAPPPPEPPKRDGLSALREAAQRRKAMP